MSYKKKGDWLITLGGIAVILGYFAGVIGFIVLAAWAVKSCVFSEVP